MQAVISVWLMAQGRVLGLEEIANRDARFRFRILRVFLQIVFGAWR